MIINVINQIHQHKVASEVTRIIVGVILIAACAQINIPLEPVPITLHTVGVMLVALLYNQRTAIHTILSYIGAIAINCPFGAGYSEGIAKLIGPTGGYFLGFIICIYVMNKLKPYLSTKTNIGIFSNCIAGTIIIYIFGIGWLSTFIGLTASIKSGLLPFIIPGFFKAIGLTIVLKTLDFVKRFGQNI